ncbi:hypothetical protein [Embleya sp. NPDC059259]|uniref:hypothetical protein n=1 Tax=unclassified Embleya TaxID=2699296 RepID=UPI0036C7496A
MRAWPRSLDDGAVLERADRAALFTVCRELVAEVLAHEARNLDAGATEVPAMPHG